MVDLFPTPPVKSTALRNSATGNFLERAREIQSTKGTLGTLGFGGDNSAPSDESSTIVDTASGYAVDPYADSMPIREIDRAQRASPVSAFPDNVAEYDNFMKLIVLKERIFETTVGVADRNKSTMTPLATIKLPLPSQLATSYAQGYKQQGIGASGRAGAQPAMEAFQKAATADPNLSTGQNLINAMKDPSKLAEELGTAGEQFLKNLGKDGGSAIVMGMTDEIAGLLGTAVGGPFAGVAAGVGANVARAAFGQAGIARNPHMAVLYEAPEFRQFNFNWDLRPRTPKESNNIRNIIKKLKYYSAPDVRNVDEMIFTYPEQFAISFKKDDYLFKTRSCVLTNVTVDYHGEGTPLYYDNGAAGNKAPAVVNLALSFTETRILQKKDINAGM